MNFKNYENAIFQISGADLKDFAEMLIASAQSELKQAKEETYLSREKVSEMLEVDKSTLWRWEKTGFLIPVHIGAKVRYRRSDIDKLLKVEEGEA
ncbi:MAG: helix-turn-helix domain-containing protein [Paludibacteraceae bacterium]|nr:helix-turn-helix domain-containing protein [Paludibacteraceae bacterium]